MVGTHALFQEDVAFHDLALAVIDEQHRFGVEQRVALAAKGRGVDILVMTATPIPRTLMLTAYGDLDASRLTEKPPGRQPDRHPHRRRSSASTRCRRRSAARSRSGAKIYWICPLVEESEDTDLAAAASGRRQLEPLRRAASAWCTAG